jgi:hypothetical protein
MIIRPFVFNDGGRQAAGFRGNAGDCVVRAIAIAAELPYRQVYDQLQRALRHQIEVVERKQTLQYGIKGHYKPNATPLTGLTANVYRPYLRWLGWQYVAKPVGPNGRLRRGEVPMGRLIVELSGHLVAVIDGVIHDTYYSASRGQRPIGGYFHKKV